MPKRPRPAPPGPTAPVSPPPSAEALAGLVGSSAPMRRLMTRLEQISRYRTNVLLLGESGTGKELIARALHARGPRGAQPFVPVNCATLGSELLENELFGHERGAFTGAHDRKQGLFELADGGTLFLDEIAEMGLSTQAKLLRVLERSAFRRVGGTEKVKVELSVIAATNRSLPDAIAAGRFREDLYYRLKVVTVVVPALRERREDIPALVDFFVADFNHRHGQELKGLTPGALQRLVEYPWPGNVRELRNAIESAAVLATSNRLGEQELELGLGLEPQARAPAAEGLWIPLTDTLADAERRLIAFHLRRARTRAEAATRLGLGLRTLYNKLKAYGPGFPGLDDPEA